MITVEFVILPAALLLDLTVQSEGSEEEVENSSLLLLSTKESSKAFGVGSARPSRGPKGSFLWRAKAWASRNSCSFALCTRTPLSSLISIRDCRLTSLASSLPSLSLSSVSWPLILQPLVSERLIASNTSSNGFISEDSST
eukprot:13926.XXX_466466_466888_1 [CDS] Oithona nana genome sequencing.